MPDLHVRLEDLVAAQDRVVARFTLHATHSTSVFGESPSGADLVLHGMTMYRFEAGRIVEDWEVMDEADLRRQVGVLDGG
jgi:predicted ester cyclase